MEINKETILSKTHYGINIYAYVLRQYYANETVLQLSGKVCEPTKNPFNEDKPSLMVSIVNNLATHTDTDNAIADGDVFDFAALHFKLSGQELLEKLNEELYLRIGQKNSFYNLENEISSELEIEAVKILPPVFSYFIKPVSNVVPTKRTTLLEIYNLIQGNEFASCTSTLRNIQAPREARKYKATNFNYATFSGVFSKRNDKRLQRHSGLLTIDFDHVSNISTLRENLLKDEYFETELLFTSPSGDGLKWIIPIELTKVKHQDYFKAVANYIQHTYSLEVDGSGKDISRACFLPHDPNVFINPKYL